jgi:hypothetical protein
MKEDINGKSLFSDDDLIYSYTRAQAIEDGVLVDVSEMAREGGIRFHVASLVPYGKSILYQMKTLKNTIRLLKADSGILFICFVCQPGNAMILLCIMMVYTVWSTVCLKG